MIEPHSDLSLDFLQFSCFKDNGKERLVYLDTDIHTTFKRIFDEDIGHHNFVINPFDVTTENIIDHNAMVENLSAAFFSILRTGTSERMHTLIEAGVDLLLNNEGSSIEQLKKLMDDNLNEILCQK